jgi:hypothetical protein
VQQETESVYQQRAALGLPRELEAGKDLTDVPPDLDQTFPAVREAASELMRGAAQLGVIPSSYDLKPKQIVEEFYKRDPVATSTRSTVSSSRPRLHLSKRRRSSGKRSAISTRPISICAIA